MREKQKGKRTIMKKAWWKEARGCKIEHQIASDYGIRILELPNLEIV